MSENMVESYVVPVDFWKEVALAAFEEIGTPYSLSLYKLLEKGEYAEFLVHCKLDPFKYNERSSFASDFRAAELLRKFDGIPGFDSGERKRAAYAKALEAERQCLDTNLRMLDLTHGSGPAGAESLLSKARRKIIHVLGEFSLGEVINHCRWGPGSDALNKRPYVAPYHKFGGRLSATKSVMPYLTSILEGNDLWATWLAAQPVEGPFSPLPVFRSGNSSLTVPKTAQTDRFICVEPGVNVYVQLGLGAVIRRRLRRVGIDLDSQEKNRLLALEGSETGLWCTIDLSSASDTVARRLVQILFDDPALHPWLRVMENLRSPFTRYPAGVVRKEPTNLLNHKFSSMGNGFTFELETLIFWAICSSVAEENGGKCAAVYGDDIIVSQDVYAQVAEWLSYFGFSVNPKKSFSGSYFRESCGMNAWNGYEITTYRLESLSSLPQMYSLHNGLRRIGLTRAAKRVLRKIPASLRFFGPSGAGDAVLADDAREKWAGGPYGLQDQWFFWGYRLRGLVFRADEHRTRRYEPAILHSFATMARHGDHPLHRGDRWGSMGLATLTTGVWEIGEILIKRELVSDF